MCTTRNRIGDLWIYSRLEANSGSVTTASIFSNPDGAHYSEEVGSTLASTIANPSAPRRHFLDLSCTWTRNAKSEPKGRSALDHLRSNCLASGCQVRCISYVWLRAISQSERGLCTLHKNLSALHARGHGVEQQ